MSEIKLRKKYIDAVKGFCIILVLFSHAGGEYVLDLFIKRKDILESLKFIKSMR